MEPRGLEIIHLSGRLQETLICAQKLERANKLIGGLGGEKARWGQQVTELTASFDLLAGDSLVASGAVSYCGPFTAKYRLSLEECWRGELSNNDLKCTENVSMSKILGEPVSY